MLRHGNDNSLLHNDTKTSYVRNTDCFRLRCQLVAEAAS